MRRTAWTIAAGVALVPITLSAGLSLADWSVTRSPFDPALVARYKAALERDPEDAASFDRLWSLYARYRTTKDLIA